MFMDRVDALVKANVDVSLLTQLMDILQNILKAVVRN